MKKKIIIFFMLFFLCTVISACSDEDGKGTNTATLEITEQFVDFKENGESQTLVITTNQAEWSATVESNGKSWCSILPDINPGNHKLTISVTPNTGKEQRSTIIIQSPNQKIPDRKTKCVIKTHINIKQNVIFGAKLKPV